MFLDILVNLLKNHRLKSVYSDPTVADCGQVHPFCFYFPCGGCDYFLKPLYMKTVPLVHFKYELSKQLYLPFRDQLEGGRTSFSFTCCSVPRKIVFILFFYS